VETPARPAEIPGLKVTWSGSNLADYPDIRTVVIPKNKGTGFCDQMLFDQVGTIGAGGNSGFQAINLAVQLGATHPFDRLRHDR
jgi:hypothetical protein